MFGVKCKQVVVNGKTKQTFKVSEMKGADHLVVERGGDMLLVSYCFNYNAQSVALRTVGINFAEVQSFDATGVFPSLAPAPQPQMPLGPQPVPFPGPRSN